MKFDPNSPFEILGKNSNNDIVKLKITHNKIIGPAKDFEIKLNSQSHAYVIQNGQDLYVSPYDLPNYVPVYSDGIRFYSIVDWHVQNVDLETYLNQIKNDYFDFSKLHREALKKDLLNSEDKENIYNDFKEIVTQLVEEITTSTIELPFLAWLNHKNIDRDIYKKAQHNGILAQQIGKFLKSKFSMIEYRVEESVTDQDSLFDIDAELIITLDLED